MKNIKNWIKFNEDVIEDDGNIITGYNEWKQEISYITNGLPTKTKRTGSKKYIMFNGVKIGMWDDDEGEGIIYK